MEPRKGKQKQLGRQDNKEQEDDMNRIYFRWDLEKERALANILRDQRNMGHKGDRGWKPIALHTASRILSTSFKTQITHTNVKNCMRTWKRCYAVVTDILSQNEFDWDDTKQMIIVENDQAWNEYVKSHEDAKVYRWKVIPNWEDIVDLCGKDQDTGEGEKMVVEANEVMICEKGDKMDTTNNKSLGGGQTLDDHTLSSSSARGAKRKNMSSSIATMTSGKRGETTSTLATSMIKMASTLEELMNLFVQKVDPKDVYDQVFGVDGLTKSEKLKACSWFMENGKQFAMLKTLPMETKKDFILMLI